MPFRYQPPDLVVRNRFTAAARHLEEFLTLGCVRGESARGHLDCRHPARPLRQAHRAAVTMTGSPPRAASDQLTEARLGLRKLALILPLATDHESISILDSVAST